jgi:hypothetical protein
MAYARFHQLQLDVWINLSGTFRCTGFKFQLKFRLTNLNLGFRLRFQLRNLTNQTPGLSRHSAHGT